MPHMTWGDLWPPYLFIFDVSTVGPHGDAFAYGYVVLSKRRQEYVEQEIAAVPMWTAQWDTLEGKEEGAGVPDLSAGLGDYPLVVPEPHGYDGRMRHGGAEPTPSDLRRLFWEHWEKWEARGALLACASLFPRKANFLRARRADVGEVHTSPDVVIDLSSVLLTAGYNPTIVYERGLETQPARNPLADARHHAALFCRAMERLNAERNPPYALTAQGVLTADEVEREWGKSRDHTER